MSLLSTHVAVNNIFVGGVKSMVLHNCKIIHRFLIKLFVDDVELMARIMVT